MLWAGRDFKAHLAPIPSTIPGLSKPHGPAWPTSSIFMKGAVGTLQGSEFCHSVCQTSRPQRLMKVEFMPKQSCKYAFEFVLKDLVISLLQQTGHSTEIVDGQSI